MYKKLIFSCCICLILITGCANSSIEENVIACEESAMLAPTEVYSYEELEELIKATKQYSANKPITKSANASFSDNDIALSATTWNIDILDSYYKPSWIPGNAQLSGIMIKDRYIVGVYALDGYDGKDSIYLADEMNNVITFEWTKGVDDGEELLENLIEAQSLQSYKENSNVYYKDLTDPNYDKNTPIMRQFSWVQDGYCFTMQIPIRVLNDIGDNLNTTNDSVNDKTGKSISNEVQEPLEIGNALKISLDD